jgi:hypothetical protein
MVQSSLAKEREF